jgi:hypothetical protein
MIRSPACCLGDHPSPYVIRVIKSRGMVGARHVSRIGEKNTQWILVRKPEGKRPHERSRRRWEDNIKLYLTETEWKSWIELIWLNTEKSCRLL